MITLRLDKNGGINKGDVQAFEHDNKSEVYIIQLYKNGEIYDLTNKNIELTMVERKRKIGDMVSLPIYNATEGKVKLEVVSDITKQDGIYDFKLTVKDTTGLIETFPSFQVKIENDITDHITGEIVQDKNFTILTEGLKALADYNIYKTNALKVPEIEQDIIEINSQLDRKANEVDLKTLENRMDSFTSLPEQGVTSVGDAELIDGRIGADGKTYTTIGNAIRGQINEVEGKISKAVVRTRNLYRSDLYDIRDGFYFSTTSGNVNANADYCAIMDYIEIEPSVWYTLQAVFGDNNLQPFIAFYDVNKTFVSGTNLTRFQAPSTAKYIRFSLKKTYKNYVIFAKGRFAKSRKFIPYLEQKREIPDIYRLYDFDSFSITNGSEYDIYDDGFIFDFTNKFNTLFVKNNVTFKANDFIFARMKIKVNKFVPTMNVMVVGGDGVYYSNIFRGLEPNKEYNIFINTGKFASVTSDKIMVQIVLTDFSDTSSARVEVSEMCCSIGHYNLWYDEATKSTLPNFNKTPYVVSLTGLDHSFSLEQMCEFVKRAFDVKKIPFTINVKNGYYLIDQSANTPYAINKGSNKISIIGESESGVVMVKAISPTKQGKIIEAGGKCSIENMTLIYTNEENIDNTGEPAYCIHLDANFDSEKVYETVIKNVTAINYCNAPIGAGLKNNQKLVYDDCDLIYHAESGKNGAFYTHAPNQANDKNCELVVNNCNILHFSDKGKAINIDNVEGMLPYTEIPCTFTRNNVYAPNNNVIDSNFKSTHKLTKWSALNNIDELNY